jgi:hypothetical protein
VRFNVRGVDHLRVCRSAIPGKLTEQVFPNAAPRPALRRLEPVGLLSSVSQLAGIGARLARA